MCVCVCVCVCVYTCIFVCLLGTWYWYVQVTTLFIFSAFADCLNMHFIPSTLPACSCTEGNRKGMCDAGVIEGVAGAFESCPRSEWVVFTGAQVFQNLSDTGTEGKQSYNYMLTHTHTHTVRDFCSFAMCIISTCKCHLV